MQRKKENLKRNLGKENLKKEGLRERLRKLKRITSQIIEGYTSLIWKDSLKEKLAKYRLKIIKEQCKCTKYYINFWGIKLLPYCRYCLCFVEVKSRCKECSCVKSNW